MILASTSRARSWLSRYKVSSPAIRTATGKREAAPPPRFERPLAHSRLQTTASPPARHAPQPVERIDVGDLVQRVAPALLHRRKVRVNQGKRHEGGSRRNIELGNQSFRFPQGLSRRGAKLGEQLAEATARPARKQLLR